MQKTLIKFLTVLIVLVLVLTAVSKYEERSTLQLSTAQIIVISTGTYSTLPLNDYNYDCIKCYVVLSDMEPQIECSGL